MTDVEDRAREIWAQTMEERGGDAKLSCAADIRAGNCDQVVLYAMLAFAAQERDAGNQGEADPLTTIRDRVRELIVDEQDGFWTSCSGCHESNEGYPTGPYSETLRCHLGGGCGECGGIGAVWDSTDYQEVAEWSQRQDRSRAAIVRILTGDGKLPEFQAGALADEIMELSEATPIPDNAVLVERLEALCDRAESVLSAMDKYNSENATHLGGAPFFKLGVEIAASRAALTALRTSTMVDK